MHSYLNSGILVVLLVIVAVFLAWPEGGCLSPTGDLMATGLIMFSEGLNN